MTNPSRTPLSTLPVRPLRDMTVRLARPHEWPKSHHLMNQRHELGFQQFAGHALRYVAEWHGQWWC